MRKIVLITASLLAIILLVIYLALSHDTQVTREFRLAASPGAVLRALSEKEKWQQWWPREIDSSLYIIDNFSRRGAMAAAAVFHLPIDDRLIPAQILVLPVAKDSSLLLVKAALPNTGNLIERLKLRLNASKTNQTLEHIGVRIKAFVENEENIYGLKIRQVNVSDSTLVATRRLFSSYPQPATIYSLFGELRTFASSHGAEATGRGMLHVQQAGNGYSVMAALPVNRALEGSDKIEGKRMVMGYLLEAEVTGGPSAIDQGFRNMEQYMQDHHRTAPAIPYQVPITDRLQEKDSSKWVTRLYYPVI